MFNNMAKVGQKWVAMTVGWKTPLKELLIGRIEVPSEKTRHKELLIDILHADMCWKAVNQTIDGMVSSPLEDLISGCIIDDVIVVQLDLLPVWLQGRLVTSMFSTDVIRMVMIIAKGTMIKGISVEVSIIQRLLFIIVSVTTGIRGIVSTTAGATTATAISSCMPWLKERACLRCLKQFHISVMEGAQSKLESHERRCL
jgi:hypothetical protein